MLFSAYQYVQAFATDPATVPTLPPIGDSAGSASDPPLGAALGAALVLTLGVLLGAAAWMALSGHKPRARTKAPYSVGRFQLVTLRLNSLHDWLMMNGVVARMLAERAAA